MGFEPKVVVVENDGFSVANRGCRNVKRLLQVRLFSYWWESEGIWFATL